MKFFLKKHLPKDILKMSFWCLIGLVVIEGLFVVVLVVLFFENFIVDSDRFLYPQTP